MGIFPGTFRRDSFFLEFSRLSYFPRGLAGAKVCDEDICLRTVFYKQLVGGGRESGDGLDLSLNLGGFKNILRMYLSKSRTGALR